MIIGNRHIRRHANASPWLQLHDANRCLGAPSFCIPQVVFGSSGGKRGAGAAKVFDRRRG
eukprot:scaffold107235_cov21-Prasinocladus_malaysianus.AAC.1